MAELATALDCKSKEKKSPEFVYDWELDKKDWALPSYEPSQRIGRTKILSIAVEENSTEIFELFEKVESVHWIDGHRFPTNHCVIAAISDYFSKEKKKFFIHATPRQVK